MGLSEECSIGVFSSFVIGNEKLKSDSAKGRSFFLKKRIHILERGRGVTERGGTVLRTSQHFSALS